MLVILISVELNADVSVRCVDETVMPVSDDWSVTVVDASVVELELEVEGSEEMEEVEEMEETED